MTVKELKELLNNFSEDDYIVAKCPQVRREDIKTPANDQFFTITEVRNIQHNIHGCRLVSIELKEDNSVEIGVK